MGVLYQAEAPEYTKEYDKVIAAAQGAKRPAAQIIRPTTCEMEKGGN